MGATQVPAALVLEIPDGMPISGIRKAAVLMVALGDERAKEIYRQLGDREIERLTQEIASLRSVSPAMSQAVLEEFHELMETQQYLCLRWPGLCGADSGRDLRDRSGRRSC